MWKKLLVLCVTTMTLMTLLLNCVRANDQALKMTKEKIEIMMKQGVPLGTSREDVIEFLDKHRIEHSGHSANAEPDNIYAIFRNVEGNTVLVTKSIQLKLNFNNNKLSSYSFKEMFTGP